MAKALNYDEIIHELNMELESFQEFPDELEKTELSRDEAYELGYKHCMQDLIRLVNITPILKGNLNDRYI